MAEEIAKVLSENPYQIILSKSKNCEYRRVQILKKEESYQVERYTQKQVFHENLSFEAVQNYINQELGTHFFQLNAWGNGKEYQILVSKKGKIHKTEKVCSNPPKEQQAHNRKKQYLSPEGELIPPLMDMGIFTKEGKIVRSMYDKYRQINRFVELIDDVIRKEEDRKEWNIIDFGCGKSYLTFILYYYFTEIKGKTVHMTGLDLKEDVIRKCNQAAEKYGYENLHFELGDINGYQPKEPIDMVITLHACDTATDFALYNAISWDASLIFSVPCCQHELNAQMESERFSILTRYGLIQERTAALMTDAIRGNLLEACGYKTDLLEFVDLSHTPKNILIRAKKGKVRKEQKEKMLREVEALMEEYHLKPTLYALLKDSGDFYS